MKTDVLKCLREEKIIAIVRGIAPELIPKLVQALLAGGIRLIEITFEQSDPESLTKTGSAIRVLREKFGDDIIPGAGTVISAAQAHIARDCGAQYIVSPNTDAYVIRTAAALGMAVFPGALTPTEIAAAYHTGADAVKVFPAGSMGPGYFSAVRAPLSHIPLIAVGGVTEKNAAEYIAAGAIGVGAGGSLVSKALTESGSWQKISELAAAYVRAVRG